MKPPSEIAVVERFAPLRMRLLELLESLSDDDWARRTAAPAWSVKDIAAHLLGGDIGILSRERDRFHPSSKPIQTYNELVILVDTLNDQWVLAARRISPRVLRELLAITGPLVEAHLSSLDLHALGEPVSWAGPTPAPVWFDIAREFTERWHHQQQIRDATARPPLYDPFFLSPVLQTFVRALPHSFRNEECPAGTVVRFEISGNAGGVWFLIKTPGAWQLSLESGVEPRSDVVVPQDLAWRMFTKGISPKKARSSAIVRGDIALALPIFRTVAVIGSAAPDA